MLSSCHQLLSSIKLVFHQTGLTEVPETTDKEGRPLSLKNKYAALLLRSLSFLHSKHLSAFSVLFPQCLFPQYCLNIESVSWYFISECLTLLCALFPGNKWPQCRLGSRCSKFHSFIEWLSCDIALFFQRWGRMAGDGIKHADVDVAQVKIVLRKSGRSRSGCRTPSDPHSSFWDKE